VPIVAPYVDRWNVLNEFNGGMAESNRIHKFNCTIAHAKAYHIIKKYSDKPVSTAHAYMDFFPKRRNDKFDCATADFYDAFCNEFFFHAIRTGELVMAGMDGIIDKDIKGSVDYWSINIYDRKMRDARCKEIRGERYPMTYTPMIDEAFYLDEFYPECVIHALTRLIDKPVFISENGCSCDDDRFRIAYITEFLCALNQAIKMGVDVQGFCYWSLLDNYEWHSFKPRFGLVNVDREGDFKRTIKPSGYFLKEIIENNGFKPEMLKKYLKELPTIKYNPGQV
jgi:beta-glucosidase